MNHKASWITNVIALLVGFLIGLVIRVSGFGIRDGPRG